MNRRVVVTGMGITSPLGIGVGKNWEACMASRSGIRKISLFDAKDLTTQFAGEVPDFDVNKHINIKDQKKMDRFIQLALVATREAVASAGWSKETLPHTRTGIVIGSGMGGLPAIEDTVREMEAKGPRRISPFFIPMCIPNLASGQVSIEFGIKGLNFCIVSACSSGAHAIGEAAEMIRRGEADVMVTGGTEAVVCKLGIGGFNAMRALSTRNDDYQKASRPFDKGRDGFVMGEGSGIIILEDYEFARKRGATIHAELVGYGANSDAFHMSAPSPEGVGAATCMQLALSRAGLNPEQVDYINAHGTSTPIGDVEETKAVKRVFGSHAKKVSVSSTKSMTGHLLGAAGGVEAILSISALARNAIPPTINLTDPDPDCDLDYTPNTPREKKMNVVLSNSFGFGGTNASLIFKRV